MRRDPVTRVTRRPAFWIAYAALSALALVVAWRLFPLAIPLVNLDITLSRADALARAVDLHLRLGLGSGVLVANPIPAESELSEAVYGPALAEALREAERAQVAGRDLTPFLLARLETLTGGATLAANESLLLHDAAVAADLAVALASLNRRR